VYADLRFTKVMEVRSMASQALEAALGMDEAESPYENTQPAPAGQDGDGDGAQASPGCWSWQWGLRMGLLATCLLLLVATVGLGACCDLNAELRRVTGVLGKMEKEMQEVQGKLNTSESTVAILRSCTAIDCCPSGWLLYRGKCLFISSEKKTWEDSRDECEKKYSQLLVTKSWSRWTVPTFLKNADIPYWIGLQKSSFPWYDYGWLEEGDPDGEGVSDAWFWVDGSLYERPWQSKSNGSCAIISRGNIKPAQCAGPDDLHFWICEKVAGPSSPF
ncbi:C-type lectin domain family 12 member B, partial [Charadrius vociferus]